MLGLGFRVLSFRDLESWVLFLYDFSECTCVESESSCRRLWGLGFTVQVFIAAAFTVSSSLSLSLSVALSLSLYTTRKCGPTYSSYDSHQSCQVFDLSLQHLFLLLRHPRIDSHRSTCKPLVKSLIIPLVNPTVSLTSTANSAPCIKSHNEEEPQKGLPIGNHECPS